MTFVMPRYLFNYVQLFSVLGRGTPEDPGGDFTMACWINAKDRAEAEQWGELLLGDYYRARFAHTPDHDRYDGSPRKGGTILEENDPDIADCEPCEYECVVGKTPEWHEPWRR